MASLLFIVAVALVASLFMSWTVGANSNSTPVAPAVGANALSILRAAFIPAFLIAQLAIVLGIPISFNKVMISSIVGDGLAVSSSSSGGGVSASKAGYTVGAWVVSMVGVGLISFGLYRLLTMVPGVT